MTLRTISRGEKSVTEGKTNCGRAGVCRDMDDGLDGAPLFVVDLFLFFSTRTHRLAESGSDFGLISFFFCALSSRGERGKTV